ncbi:hypothetical protein J8F10_05845 [Gemmata sp. G18]|uniref:Uncharacterized protein n=1 Tax=Gemmata palustris TaxID=2822762 RepID=A0ABS5BM99_9BACT|nr:hypothetical protein [Gemmata palustris]MBP3954803.1 hypothetical protein [Gemmata palustris]
MTASCSHDSGRELTKRALSPARHHLVELLQRLNFGRIEGLEVRGGEPVLAPMPRVIREHKFAGDNGPRPEAGRPDCRLKSQVADLMHLLDNIGDGTIEVLSVKHGLPFHAELPG